MPMAVKAENHYPNIRLFNKPTEMQECLCSNVMGFFYKG